MSSSMVTIEVPRDENETVFLLHVVQAALKAYRTTPSTSGQAHDAPRLFEKTILSPTSA
ncbi:MAG TPA: hypothetical protein VL329_09220 [Nitrospiraceae bacterium]|jgi:hypothetical protein|nr:hypothetical protein [Nitrospiraceae bacterium]